MAFEKVAAEAAIYMLRANMYRMFPIWHFT